MKIKTSLLNLYEKHPNICLFVVSLFLGFLSSLLANQIASFLYAIPSGATFSVDASSYIFGGKLLLSGYKPYFDFYETKGLYIFYYTALGGILGGMFGMMIVQTLTLGVAYYFFFKALKEYQLKREIIILAVLTFFSIFILIGQSPSVTELLLPFTFVSIYYFIKGYKQNNYRYYLFGNIFTGISAGIAIHSRPSDAIFAFSLVIYFIVKAIRNKEYKALLFNAGVCLASLIAISLPVVIHAFAGGFLKEMYQASILSNIGYVSSAHGGASTFKLTARLMVAFLALVFGGLIAISGYKKWIEKEEIIFYAILFGVNLVFQFVIAYYLHYLLINIPLFVLFVARILNNFEFKKVGKYIIRGVVSALIVAACVTYPTIYYVTEYDREKSINAYIQETISKEDRNKNTIGYQTSCSIYMNNNITVGYGDYAFQSDHVVTSKVFTLDSLKSYVSTIKYVIYSYEYAETYKDDEFIDWINKNEQFNKDQSTHKGAEYIAIFVNNGI